MDVEKPFDMLEPKSLPQDKFQKETSTFEEALESNNLVLL